MDLSKFIANMVLQKIKRKVRRLTGNFFRSCAYLFLKRIPSQIKDAKGLKILIYHGVCGDQPFKFNSRFVSEKQFEEQLLIFQECYNLISFEDFVNKRFSNKKLNILITFDDGLKNNFDIALPLLVKHKIPAVFFISTQNKETEPYLFNDLLDVFASIGPLKIKLKNVEFHKKKKWGHYRYYTSNEENLTSYYHSLNTKERSGSVEEIFRQVPLTQFKKHEQYLARMSDSDIRELAQTELMTVGSHGVTHVDFSCIGSAELENELHESKISLEKMTSKTCSSIAFPYGNYNAETLKKCKALGYTELFGTEKISSAEDRNFIIERMTINPYVSPINLAYYIAKGNYE